MSARRSDARNRIEAALFRFVAGLFAALPLKTSSRFAGALVRFYLRLDSSRRRLLYANVAAAFPEKTQGEVASLSQSSADALGSALVEFLGVSKMSEDDIRTRVRGVGEEHFEAAIARGRGVLFLSAHFGGWELGALRASFLDVPVSLVVRPLDNPLLESELASRRTRFGNRLIPKREAARGVLRALGRGEIVIILIDQDVRREEGVFVPFFGRPAATSPALALFQLKTGAPVLPVFVWPEGDGRYRAEFEEPILAEEFQSPEISRDEAVRRATARYTEVIEAAIRKNPAAWLWMHGRWKTRPLEEAAVSSKQ